MSLHCTSPPLVAVELPPPPPPDPSRLAKARATTMANGEKLLELGYRIEPYPTRPNVFAVYPPAGKPRGPRAPLWHDVDLSAPAPDGRPGLCTCDGQKALGVCLHAVGVRKWVAWARRLVTPTLLHEWKGGL